MATKVFREFLQKWLVCEELCAQAHSEQQLCSKGLGGSDSQLVGSVRREEQSPAGSHSG